MKTHPVQIQTIAAASSGQLVSRRTGNWVSIMWLKHCLTGVRPLHAVGEALQVSPAVWSEWESRAGQQHPPRSTVGDVVGRPLLQLPWQNPGLG